jgi:hypothetical protein
MLVCPNCKSNTFNGNFVKKGSIVLVMDGENIVMNPLSVSEEEAFEFESCQACGQAVAKDGSDLLQLTACVVCGDAGELDENGNCAECVAKMNELAQLDPNELIKRIIQMEKMTQLTKTSSNEDLTGIDINEVI